jgi:sugar phosphate isomerase/epimerase
MRLGRDYTNCLVFDYLSEAEKKAFKEGKLDIGSINAIALHKAKLDVKRQIEVTREIGFSHVELDADLPNPYLNLSKEERAKIKRAAEYNDVTLSLHLPYSYIGSAVCCMQEIDRATAVELHKKCIEFASDVGAKYANIHPGSVPFYHAVGKYKERTHRALVESLVELAEFASKHDVALHLENNVTFDNAYSEIGDCVLAIEDARQRGVDVYFNFDIGHWFTRADAGKEIPSPPEKVMEILPREWLKEIHLNDYVPGKKMFHPPLHLEWGLLKRENLKRYAETVKRKGVEVIVLETSLKNNEQVLDCKNLLKAESQYVREIFGA